MKGDFSRPSVDGRHHYVGVLHQQGRVWLDSDWNADILQRLGRAQRETADVVGVCGVPAPGSAFRVSPNPDATAAPDDFRIEGGEGAAGRCYVHGVLCQLDASTSYLSQPDLLDPPRIPVPTSGSDVLGVVYLEVWQRLITHLEDDTLREVALGGPDTATRLRTVAQVRVAIVPSSVPAADVTCETAGQFLPGAGRGTLTTLQPPDSVLGDLCRLPDPALFTGRENHLYRVEIHDGGDVTDSASGLTVDVKLGQDADAGARALVLATPLDAIRLDAVTRWGTLTLVDDDGRSERVTIADVSSDRTVLTLHTPLHAAFTTTRNTTLVGVARFKWSRDNAAFAVRVTAVGADRRTLTLESLGRDAATALRQGDLVEVSDDASELGPARGHLTFLVADPDPDQFTVPVADDLPEAFDVRPDASRHLVLRRWDGQGTAKATFGQTATPDMNLGDGVHVQFGGADLRAGDYWQFAARSADGSVEALTEAPPAGIRRDRSPLAIVRWTLGTPGGSPSNPSGIAFQVVADCRRVFSPLSELPQAEDGMRITRVSTIDPDGGSVSPLVNDSDVLVNNLMAGIAIECEHAVEPTTISRATCFLSVEIPSQVPSATEAVPPLLGYQVLLLAGDVGVGQGEAANTIVWQPTADTSAALAALPLLKFAGDRGILARLTLRGNFIWARDNPGLLLDGDAFALANGGTITTSLSLPTGDRRRGGTFEMWFWLVARPVVLTGLALDPVRLTPGDTATGTLTLSDVAPPGGIVVALTTSDPGVAHPSAASVTIPAGRSTETFHVTANAAGTATITASAGSAALTTTLTVVQKPIVLIDLQLDPTAILIGGTSTGTVTLSRVAPASGVSVALSSGTAGVIDGLPQSLTITASATGTFTVTGRALGTTVIQGVLGATRAATLTVFRPKRKETKEAKDKDKDKEVKEGGKENLAKEIDTPVVGPVIRAPAPARPSRSTRTPRPPGEASGRRRRVGRTRSPRPPQGVSTGGVEPIDEAQATGRAFIRPEERPVIG
jgi:hypothetical protein